MRCLNWPFRAEKRGFQQEFTFISWIRCFTGGHNSSGPANLFTEVFSKSIERFPLFCHADFTKCMLVHFQALQISNVPPGAFPDGPQNSCPSLKRHRCQTGAHSLSLARCLFPGCKRATFGGHFIALNQLYFNQTGPLPKPLSWKLFKGFYSLQHALAACYFVAND